MVTSILLLAKHKLWALSGLWNGSRKSIEGDSSGGPKNISLNFSEAQKITEFHSHFNRFAVLVNQPRDSLPRTLIFKELMLFYFVFSKRDFSFKEVGKNQQHVVIMYSISLYVEREALWIFFITYYFSPLCFVECFFSSGAVALLK